MDTAVATAQVEIDNLRRLASTNDMLLAQGVISKSEHRKNSRAIGKRAYEALLASTEVN